MTSGENQPPEGASEPAEGPPPGYGQQPPPTYGEPPPPAYGDQPAYGQPAYGQQQPPGGFGQYQYGQPMYGGGGAPPAPYTQPRARFGVGVVGTVLAIVGAALGIIALTALDWYKGSPPSHFTDINDAVKVLHANGLDTGIGYVYFRWLAWVLLAAAVVVAVLANLPSPASAGLRVLGALLGLAGIGITFWAIDIAHGFAYTTFLKDARVGFYFMLAAFLLTFLASLIGPRKTS